MYGVESKFTNPSKKCREIPHSASTEYTYAAEGAEETEHYNATYFCIESKIRKIGKVRVI